MPYAFIPMKDSTLATHQMKVNRRGTDNTPVVEQESVTPYVNIDLGVTGQVVTAAAAYLHNWTVFNRDTVALYAKVYDKATAATGSDTPKIVWEVLPGQAFPFAGEVTNGIAFALGISVRCTTGVAHADTGAPAANGCVMNLGHRPG